MTGAFERLRQFACSLHGHDAVLNFEPGRLSLRCVSCGYQTPGWTLRGETVPRVQRWARGSVVGSLGSLARLALLMHLDPLASRVKSAR
jgi:hypothetical protein